MIIKETVMFNTPPRYHTFVLRIWEERSGEGDTAVWRYSLHNTDESSRIGFNSMEDLTSYLQLLLDIPTANND